VEVALKFLPDFWVPVPGAVKYGADYSVTGQGA